MNYWAFWIFFSWNTRKICYGRVLNIPFLKYKKSSVMAGFWIFLCWSIKMFLFMKCIEFFSGFLFLEIWEEIFHSFRFLKYKKFCRGRSLLLLELGVKSACLHFRKYKEFFSEYVFLFSGGLGWEVAQVALNTTTLVIQQYNIS